LRQSFSIRALSGQAAQRSEDATSAKALKECALSRKGKKRREEPKKKAVT
jgi:hypothetical protein